MPPHTSPAGRGRFAVTTLALLALAALLAVRLHGLAVEPRRLTGERERAFFGWAYREPRIAEKLGELERQLSPGEPVFLVLEQPDLGRAKWWRFMASSFLAGNPVLGARPRPAAGAAPTRAALVLLAGDGSLHLLRHGRGFDGR